VGRAQSTHERDENAYSILVGKPEGEEITGKT
jgi:hypothetical protein